MRVLLVDDDAWMRQALSAALESRGHDVCACEDAATALEVVAREPFTLAVFDWMMPGMDGLELVRRVRAMEGGEHLVILIVTTRNEPHDLQAVLDAGADDYLRKPIDPAALMVRLEIAESRVRTREAQTEADRRLAETVSELQQSHDDLKSILDGLLTGSVLTDSDGRVTFLSSAAQRLLGVQLNDVAGEHWSKALPFDRDAREGLRAMAARPRAKRHKIATAVERAEGGRAVLEVELGDDPRDERRKVLMLYDVTDVHELRQELTKQARFGDMVGRSPAMQQVYQLIRDLGTFDTTVLIEGETGSGKELAARALHDSSPRRDGPFIAVNCAGLTESLVTSQLFGHVRGAFTGAIGDRKGVFEAADGGTLLLDEIGDIPTTVQTALLRVLETRDVTRVGETRSRKIDVRLIAATHRDLGVEVAAGRFRADLLYRIRVARLVLPPLRARREDIPLLVATFLRQIQAKTGRPQPEVTADGMRMMLDYPWPGNVRELKGALEFAVIRCRGGNIGAEDLPPELTRGMAVQDTAALLRSTIAAPIVKLEPEDERAQILAALEQAGGNRSRAAKLIGVSRATFYRHLSRLGISPPG